MKFSYTVSAAESGQNVLHLCKRVMDIPFGKLQKALRTKAIKLNGKKSTGKELLNQGDVLTSIFPFDTLQSEPTPAEDLTPFILYEDDSILVINKPSGIAVHSGSKLDSSVDAMVTWHFKDKQFTPKPAHRLDKGTSGVLLYGKTIATLNTLSDAFKSHKAQKTYHALVHGTPEFPSGTFHDPLLTQDDHHTKTIVSSSGKPALTEYSLISSKNKCSLLKLSPTTGRTHQLRVHLAHHHTPIIGDTRYGDTEKDNLLGFPKRLYLHCSSISIPELGQWNAPLPSQWPLTS